MQNQFRFSLLGSNIELRSNCDPAYMEQAFRYLEHKVAMTQDALRLNDSMKIAIITAFLLVDDLLTERAEREKLLSHEDGMAAEILVKKMLQELAQLPYELPQDSE